MQWIYAQISNKSFLLKIDVFLQNSLQPLFTAFSIHTFHHLIPPLFFSSSRRTEPGENICITATSVHITFLNLKWTTIGKPIEPTRLIFLRKHKTFHFNALSWMDVEHILNLGTHLSTATTFTIIVTCHYTRMRTTVVLLLPLEK